ncbi:hypothetical protein [Rubellimicrobium aerolatum]|uniref:Uncharacterized protein n=1 Tax=Rubellimicrobium aerolatum TaxID=490979 RepID=A0ABW0S970_9RHOB|nr:hypothetical protein [Rubellimicrobium aerolatum]MBP1804850.1 hypothetical protein [Rubellimicrobium aerolatum]
MSSKMPPIPPGNRSDKGPVSAAHPDDPAVAVGNPQKANPDKIGQAGNSKVNTTHQGLQQDR